MAKEIEGMSNLLYKQISKVCLIYCINKLLK
jgi:hypothetical protein